MDIKKVLIVEDEILHQRAIRRAFDNRHDLTFIDNGKNAIEWLNTNTPDLVLLDLNIPRFSGIEVLKKVINGRKIMVIVMTSSDNHVDVKRVYDNGGMGYIVKPAKYDDIIKAVENLAFHPNFRRPTDKGT